MANRQISAGGRKGPQTPEMFAGVILPWFSYLARARQPKAKLVWGSTEWQETVYCSESRWPGPLILLERLYGQAPRSIEQAV